MDADAAASPNLAARVAQVVQPYLAKDEFPGISVAVVTDGQVALVQGYGISNVATGSPVEANTRFDIGSVTKTFTALGVLLLYQESQGTSHPLDLDAPISDYLHNTVFQAARQMVPGHHEGAARHDQRHPGSGDAQPWQAQLAVDRERAASSLPPGRRRSYSNSNYHLLGELIEQWTGESTAPSSRIRSWSHSGCPRPRSWAGPDGLEPGGRLRRTQAREVAEGRGAERTRDVRRRRDGLDGPGHGHLYDGTPERPSPRSRDLRDDVDLDTDAAIRGESPVRRHARPGMGYGDRHEHRALEVTKSGTGPRIHVRAHPLSHPDSGVFVSFNTNYAGSRNPNGVTGLEVARSVFKAAKDNFLTAGSIPDPGARNRPAAGVEARLAAHG